MMPLMSTPSPSRSHPRSTAQPFQRSFTLPTKLANTGSTPSSPAVEIGASAAIETLYVHPGAKVVSFSTAGSSLSRPTSSSSRVSSYGGSNLEIADSGSLPWHNATERTLAAGPLEIYRVPGSVSFLHSGALLHAILPRSQCWLVDGVSKFAFRVRPDTYYRLELPASTPEDLELVEGLKETLGKVLYYERTSCPFRRGFGEGLPEMPDQRRALSRGGSVGPAKKWKFESRWRPEGYNEEAESSDSQTSRPGSIYEKGRDRTPEPGRREGGAAKEEDRPGDGSAITLTDGRVIITPVTVPRGLRSVTAPQLSLRTSVPSKSKVPQIAGRINDAVRTQQIDGATSTPVRRRQSQIVDAPTLALPPTPESLRDVYVEETAGRALPEEGEGDNTENANYGYNEEQEEREQEKEMEAQMAAEEKLTTETCAPAQRTTRELDEKQPRNPEAQLSEFTEATDPLQREQSSLAAMDDFDSTPRTPPLTDLLPAAAIEIPHPLPDTAATIPHLHPSHVRHVSSDCDYAQDAPTKIYPSISPVLSSTPSPDPSVASSLDSWTSLPTLPAGPIRTPSSDILNILRSRRGRSTASSSDADSYHSLTAPPSHESLSQQDQPQRPLHTLKPQTRTRSPSTSALIAQASALLVKRTASLFLGPPAHLVALMLRIAARLVAGGATASPDAYGVSVNVEAETESHTLGGLGMSRSRELRGDGQGQQVRGRRLGHRRVPGSFEFSDDEEEWGGM